MFVSKPLSTNTIHELKTKPGIFILKSTMAKKKKPARKASNVIAMEKKLSLKRWKFILLASVIFQKGTQSFIVFKSLKGTIM